MPETTEEPQEEEEKEPVAQPPQSDDTRVENMDISDEGAGVPVKGRQGLGAKLAGRGPEPVPLSLQRMLVWPHLYPLRPLRRMRRSWSCRSSWRRGVD